MHSANASLQRCITFVREAIVRAPPVELALRAAEGLLQGLCKGFDALETLRGIFCKRLHHNIVNGLGDRCILRSPELPRAMQNKNNRDRAPCIVQQMQENAGPERARVPAEEGQQHADAEQHGE